MVDVQTTNNSPGTVTVVDTSSGGLRDKMEVVIFKLGNQWETLQVHSSSFIHLIQHKLNVLFGDAGIWIEDLNIHGRIGSIWDNATAKSQEFLTLLTDGVHVVQFQRCFAEFKSFLKNEVSTQAIYFGCAGLVTGGVVGLVLGYSFKFGSSSSQNCVSHGSGNLMRAIRCLGFNRGIDGITLSTISVPQVLRPHDVLIQVKAMAIDNIDAKVAYGYKHLLRQHMGLSSIPESFILGRECSGVVMEIGSQVTTFDINDRVWVCLPIWSKQGIMSEYIVVPEEFVGHKPRNISFEGAATLPYATLVAWQTIFAKPNLSPTTTKNKRILIHLGATSKNDGVGLLATQVLKSWGGRITISTQENTEDETNAGSGVAQMTFLHSLKSLGAESHIIIPNDESLLPDLAQRIFEVVINSDSTELTPLLQNFCKEPEGSVVETFPLELEKTSWRIFSLFSSAFSFIFRKPPPKSEPNTSFCLDECKRMVESNLVVPVVARSFLASQYDQAFRHVSDSSSSSALIAHSHVGKSVIVFRYP